MADYIMVATHPPCIVVDIVGIRLSSGGGHGHSPSEGAGFRLGFRGDCYRLLLGDGWC
jgi:hypothetical protein